MKRHIIIGLKIICIVIAAIIVIISAAYIYMFLVVIPDVTGTIHMTKQDKKYVNQIIEIAESGAQEFYLDEIFTFEWDVAYLVGVPTIFEEMEKIVGNDNKLEYLPESKIARIIFMKSDKLVCEFRYLAKELDFSCSFNPIPILRSSCKITITEDRFKTFLVPYHFSCE